MTQEMANRLVTPYKVLVHGFPWGVESIRWIKAGFVTVKLLVYFQKLLVIKFIGE